MKTVMRTLTVMLTVVTPALAGDGGAPIGSSLLIILFLGFGALIVVFQFIPALILFYAGLRGLFAPQSKNATRRVLEGTGKR